MSRRRCDHARAARNQAAVADQQAFIQAASQHDASEADSAQEIILPFKGKVLPLNPGFLLGTPDASPATFSENVLPTHSPPPWVQVTASAKADRKSPVGQVKKYIDVNSARKNLFPTGIQQHLKSQEPHHRCYQEKEDMLLSKLFSNWFKAAFYHLFHILRCNFWIYRNRIFV